MESTDPARRTRSVDCVPKAAASASTGLSLVLEALETADGSPRQPPVDSGSLSTSLDRKTDPSPVASRPSLLPAFEPSCSPSLPKSNKRKYDDYDVSYPSPIPTSSAAPSSSRASASRPAAPTISALMERAPLAAVPTLVLPANGEPLLMGRSSNSSDYQLTGGRQISRIHIRASYLAAEPEATDGKIEVECLGWNGAKVHCRGSVFSLNKGDIFVTEQTKTQVLVDVHDARVILLWPQQSPLSPDSDTETEPDSASPTPRAKRARTSSLDAFESSPPRFLLPADSPGTPTPAERRVKSPASLSDEAPDTLTPFGVTDAHITGHQHDTGVVEVYEDASEDEEAVKAASKWSPVSANEANPPLRPVSKSPTPDHDDENDALQTFVTNVPQPGSVSKALWPADDENDEEFECNHIGNGRT